MAEKESEFSLKHYFVPLTTVKAIHFLILIGIVVFASSLFNGFVWDDYPFIVDNLEIHSLHLLSQFGMSYFNNSGYYRPIPAIYFSLLYAVSGATPFFYHLAQLVLHLINCCLIFILFKKFFKTELSFFLSLIFLLHPIQVESVVFIAASQSELFFLTGCLALLVMMRNRIDLKQFILSGGLLLLSFLTKESGAMFIFLVVLYQFLFAKKYLKPSLIMSSLVIVAYAAIRFLLGHIYFGRLGYAPITHLSFTGRLLNIPPVFLYYLQTFFFPKTLVIDQQWVVNKLSFQTFYLPLSILLTSLFMLLIVGLYLFRKNQQLFKPYLFFTAWFFSGMAVLLQIFPLDMTVADRWFYFPIVGLLGILGVVIQSLIHHLSFPPLSLSFQPPALSFPRRRESGSSNYVFSPNALKQLLVIFAILIIILLSIRTIIRASNWHDLLSLYSHDTPLQANFDNENNYGVVLVQNGDVKAGLHHFLTADHLYPTEFTYRDTGLAYLALNQKDKAYDYLTKAITTKSYVLPPHQHQTITYDSMARYYLIYKDYANAKTVLDKGLQDYPLAYTLWYLQAINDYYLGDNDSAKTAAQKAYDLNPSPETASLYLTLLKNKPLNIKIIN